MSNSKIRYAVCDFDENRGQVLCDNGSLVWHEGTLQQAKIEVETKRGKCALFLPREVAGKGCPVYPEVSREQFEREPGVYGVCFYRSHSGYVFE